MNLSDMFKLMPLMDDIQKAVAVAQKYMNNPEVPRAIELIKQIEGDPEVKAALATAAAVAKVLSTNS
jgi:uncharacterized protein YjgD (DUF1641 family)